MSNAIPMLQHRSRECPGTQPRQPLTDGRAAKAASYPLGRLRAILDGMVATRDSERCAHETAEDSWDCTLTMAIAQANEHALSNAAGLPDSSIPKVGGGEVDIHYEASNVRTQYVDEDTRPPRPNDRVPADICE